MSAETFDIIEAVLHQVQREITFNVHRPNWGGCAVVAALVGKRLQEFTKVEVVVESGNRVDFDEIRTNNNTEDFETADDWTSNSRLLFNHIRLKFLHNGKWKTFDSDAGITDYYANSFCSGSMTVEETKTIAGKDIGWNYAFNRRQIPKMARIVRDAFKPLTMQAA